MRAVVCHQRELTVEDLPDPVPGEGHVLLEVVRSGICGSDLHARLHGDVLADEVGKVGLTDMIRPSNRTVLGHEFSGRVLAYGPKTRRQWPEGTPVCSVPMIRMDGRIQMTGLSPKAPGSYAEKVLVQESMTVPVTNGYSVETAALTEPLAVAHHAVRKSSIGRRETAVVIGCGPIGLAVILMLKARGVKHVIASDYSSVRRGLAVKCGADAVVDPAADSPWSSFEDSRYYTQAPPLLDFAFKSVEQLRRVPMLPWPRLMRAAERAGQTPTGPVVFECVGVPGVIDHIMQSAPIYSRVVVVGVCMEPDRIQPAMGTNKEISLQWVFAYDPGEYADTLAMLCEGKLDPAVLHTGTVGLDGVAAAFEDLSSAEHHAKVLIDPSWRP